MSLDLKKFRQLAQAIVDTDSLFGYTPENINAYRVMQGHLTGPVLLELVEKAETVEKLLNRHSEHTATNPDGTTESTCRTCCVEWPCIVSEELVGLGTQEPLAQWEIDLMRGTVD